MDAKNGTTPREFYERVKRMRSKQKEYFKTRSKDSLIIAKQLEGTVDGIISATEAKLQAAKQGNLFGNQDEGYGK